MDAGPLRERRERLRVQRAKAHDRAGAEGLPLVRVGDGRQVAQAARPHGHVDASAAVGPVWIAPCAAGRSAEIDERLVQVRRRESDGAEVGRLHGRQPSVADERD